jgi:hypothetical protein
MTHSLQRSFVKANGAAIKIENIHWIDYKNLEDLVIHVFHLHGCTKVTGIEAIELLMIAKPSVFEGKRLRWARRMWMFHNFVGHPMMQLLSLFKRYKLAMLVHDMTVPKPLGRRVENNIN